MPCEPVLDQREAVHELNDEEPAPVPREGLERALARISERYRELVEHLPAVVYEAEPGPGGAFRYVSPQIEELLGYSAEEWMAEPELWLDRLHPDDSEGAVKLEREHVSDARGGEARVRNEYRMIHRDGRTVCVRDEARLITSGEGAPVWHGVLIDITASTATTEHLNAPGGDAMRANCPSCGASWIAERDQACPRCGSTETEAISLNATLEALARSRRQVEDLLSAIHLHLDSLGDAVQLPQSGDW